MLRNRILKALADDVQQLSVLVEGVAERLLVESRGLLRSGETLVVGGDVARPLGEVDVADVVPHVDLPGTRAQAAQQLLRAVRPPEAAVGQAQGDVADGLGAQIDAGHFGRPGGLTVQTSAARPGSLFAGSSVAISARPRLPRNLRK